MSRSEQVILTNMCMIYDDKGNILVQRRADSVWPGVTFPGGHIEPNESFHSAVIREVYEETGLTIKHPQLCGSKQFRTKENYRYVVLFYKTREFHGELQSSAEGEVFWIPRDKLTDYELAEDFLEMIDIFEDDLKTEFYYAETETGWDKQIF